jgi:DNA-binding transcriptional regulator YiaG
MPSVVLLSKSKAIFMTGAELKALRKSIGLSLAQASRQVEVSSRTWARWEVSDEPPQGAIKLFQIENGLRKPGK